MPTHTETYSIASDFAGVPPILSQLVSEISNSGSGITTVCNGINIKGDGIDIIFEDTISAGEKTALDTLISEYAPSTEIGYGPGIRFATAEKGESFTERDFTVWKTIREFKFPGTAHLKASVFSIIASSDKDAPNNKMMRIFDVCKGEEIGMVTWTDQMRKIYQGTLSNLPENQSIFEIQLKKDTTGGDGNPRIHFFEIF